MTIQEIIESKINLQDELHAQLMSIPWWIWLMLSLSLVSLLLTFLIRKIDRYEDYWLAPLIIGLCFIFGSIYFYIHNLDSKTDLLIATWRNDIVNPFIESLPIEKKEIIYIKIDTELSHEIEGESIWGIGYTKSTPVERTPLTVSFKDQGIVTKTNWFETHMELTEEEKPFIEFQRLKRNLGYGVNAGYYNVKVYLPRSYQFTEIK
ncbi:hypothetical protein FOA22_13955 [Heyndrickxia oleronia]|uniref:hypothetical protein n=1 Tax=Heyndrickxia oleronia TaxID=38875 RepID=UPI00333A9568